MTDTITKPNHRGASAGKNKKYRNVTCEHRKTIVAQMYMQGYTQAAIAHKIGIHNVRVSAMLKEIREEWKLSRERDFEEHVAEQLAKIDQVEKEAWAGWQRSCKNAESAKQSEKNGFELLVKGQAGDNRFLDTVLKCVERRCRLLGLDEQPEKPFDGQIEVYVDLNWYGNVNQLKEIPNVARTIPETDKTNGDQKK